MVVSNYKEYFNLKLVSLIIHIIIVKRILHLRVYRSV
jgi:hypothetical protein